MWLYSSMGRLPMSRQTALTTFICGVFASECYLDEAVGDAGLISRDRYRWIIEALARLQVEALFVDRGGDLGNVALAADDAPADDHCLGERTPVGKAVDFFCTGAVDDPDDRNLAFADQGGGTGVGSDVADGADRVPGEGR